MTYSNLQIFIVELIGTFILVVFATGSIVYDAEFFNGELGIPFAALAPFIATFDPQHTLLVDDSLSVLRSAERYGIAHLLAV